MATAIPKVYYFSASGRAEFIKLVLEEAGAPYEFVPCNGGEHTRPPLSDRLAYGQLPAYEEEGLGTLVQTGTIVRYLARKYGLVPTDPKDAARADMVADGTYDYIGKYFGVIFYKNLTKEDFVNKAAPQWLAFFDRLLRANRDGKGFVVGDKLSFADLNLFHVLDVTAKFAPQVLDAFPLLKEYHARIAARPNIAAFLKSERRFNPPN